MGGKSVRHEQRAPETVFSEEALSQVQARADFSPQEQVAWAALRKFVSLMVQWLNFGKRIQMGSYHAQPCSPFLPQQVVGTGILMVVNDYL